MSDNQQFIVRDGTTSVGLDAALLESAAGLTLSGATDTIDPESDAFGVGFDITEESDFLFSDTDGFAPITGEIEHTGTITFSSELGPITVGDFTIGFDGERVSETTSGFFVANTIEGVLPDGAILFDIAPPEAVEIESGELSIGSADLLVSSEFAGVLLDTELAAADLTGADVGDARIDSITDDLTGQNLNLVKDGTTSVGLDTALLESAAGLTLSGADDVVDPESDAFAVGFDITEETDFLFSDTDGFAPIQGEIEHTGTITFSSELGHITVGDFTIGFDGERVSETTSGFFVANTVEGVLPDGAILFDIAPPEAVEIESGELSIGNADLLVSSEFAGVLLDTELAAADLTGADVGDARIDSITDDFIDPQLNLVQDGTTSVGLDAALLESAAGLTLSGATDTIHPESDIFGVGFDITEESDFLFSDTDGFAPVTGEIEHTGTITFSSELGHITVGDFTIGFDGERVSETTSGFFVANTVEGVLPDGAILFDIAPPEAVEIESGELSIGSADLLVSSEFAGVLLDTELAAADLTGADVGDARIDALFI